MAMEDFRVDVVVGKGPGATAIPLEINPFTLVGATTRAGLLTGPLRDRFGFVGQMEFYEPAELQQVLRPQRRAARRRADRRRVRGDRRPLPRHTAHRQPAAAPGARLRRGGGRRAGHPRGGPGRARALRRRRPRAGPAGPGRPRGAGRPVRRRTGRRRDPRRRRGGGAATPSRRSASRSSCGPACWPAPRAGGSPPRPPGTTWASRCPVGGALLGGAGGAISGLTGAPATPGASSEPLFGA